MVGVAHIRIDLLGTLCSGAEKWSMGFSTAPPGGGALADLENLAITASTLFQADVWGTSTINDYGAVTSKFLGARASQLTAAGKVTASAESILASPSTAGNTLAMPPQSSVVVSLRTGLSGPRHRGRMYFPALGSTALTATGRLQPAARDSLASAMQLFFDDWNDDPTTFTASVASNAGQFVEAITSIKVGDVIDTQRRRRDALPEAYVDRAITV